MIRTLRGKRGSPRTGYGAAEPRSTLEFALADRVTPPKQITTWAVIFDNQPSSGQNLEFEIPLTTTKQRSRRRPKTTRKNFRLSDSANDLLAKGRRLSALLKPLLSSWPCARNSPPIARGLPEMKRLKNPQLVLPCVPCFLCSSGRARCTSAETVIAETPPSAANNEPRNRI